MIRIRDLYEEISFIIKAIRVYYTALFLVAFVVTAGCKAQLVKTSSDLSKLKTAEKTLAGQSLAKFLREIGLPITRVTAIATENPEHSPGFFRFQFQDVKTIDSLKSRNALPLGVLVYIKEAFDWDYLGRPDEQKNVWTADDARRYGHLTVTRLRVLGPK